MATGPHVLREPDDLLPGHPPPPLYGYSHVQPRRHVTMGEHATLAPNVSLETASASVGARTQIGERALPVGRRHERAHNHRRAVPVRPRGLRDRVGLWAPAGSADRLPGTERARRRHRQRRLAGCAGLRRRRRDDRRRVRGERGLGRYQVAPPGSVAVGIPARIVRRREDYAPRTEQGTDGSEAAPSRRDRRLRAPRERRRLGSHRHVSLPGGRSHLPPVPLRACRRRRLRSTRRRKRIRRRNG